jgi:hypothetical protein
MNDRPISGYRPIWRWLTITTCFGLLATAFLQWRTIERLQSENEVLREEQPPARPEPSAPNRLSDAGQAPELKRSEEGLLELLQLRNEVRKLREQVAQAAFENPPASSPPAAAVVAETSYRDSEVQQWGIDAMGGDARALDNMANLALAALDMDTNDQAAVRSEIGLVFQTLGTEAGRGNAAALQAVWQATRIRGLQDYAVKALGQAAGQGNEEALKPLLNPEDYLILRSSAVSALKPAADAGNPRAIQALATVAADPNQHPLWFMAAQGLEAAAIAGDSTAIDALAALATDEDRNVHRKAVLTLEAAARGNQVRAEEALRNLGWR